jgi:hypothetical protein
MKSRISTSVVIILASTTLLNSPLVAAKTVKAVKAAGAMSVEEKLAESVWKLRAALNVAALQCQFDPGLATVSNYNQVNKIHKAEVDSSRATLEGYYRRQYGRGGLNVFDKFNTKLWNNFSSVNYQRPFCQKASDVGKEAIAQPEGSLTVIANNRVQEILAIFPAPVKAIATSKTSAKKKSGKKKAPRRKK